jgi:lipopolysaccharide/colanic/teichoic acid biosynthesis glycosyltransferase
MYTGADKQGALTVGMRDPRITKVGYYLRKYKLDELPQLINVLKGEMSLVGHRPELLERVLKLPENWKKYYINFKPGITCYASIEYIKENELLEKVKNEGKDVEEYYMQHILPHKIKLNEKYYKNPNIFHDIKLIILTILKILKLK